MVFIVTGSPPRWGPVEAGMTSQSQPLQHEAHPGPGWPLGQAHSPVDLAVLRRRPECHRPGGHWRLGELDIVFPRAPSLRSAALSRRASGALALRASPFRPERHCPGGQGSTRGLTQMISISLPCSSFGPLKALRRRPASAALGCCRRCFGRVRSGSPVMIPRLVEPECAVKNTAQSAFAATYY